MNGKFKSAIAAFGFLAASAVAAQAAPQNFHPCLDVAGQGFGGLACTVAANDVFNFGGGITYQVPNSGNDHQATVEAALRWVFGEAINLYDGEHGLENDEPGFNFSPNQIDNDDSFTVELDEAYTFATVKASTFFIIFDVRGLTELDLGTEGYIHNFQKKNGTWKDKGPIDVSHVSFWRADFGPDLTQVPVPGALSLLGLGLIGLGIARRWRG